MLVPGVSTFKEVLEVSQHLVTSMSLGIQTDKQDDTGRTYVVDFDGSSEKFFVSQSIFSGHIVIKTPTDE